MSLAQTTLYETDFYGWIQQQAARLRSRNINGLDFDNLVEEIESMGRSEKRELESRLELLLMHLLKWVYQPQRRGSSWEATIVEQRDRLADHLRDNPSLKSLVPEIYDRTYRYAVTLAVKETGMGRPTFPATCPWSFDEAMDDGFWPEAEAPAASAAPPAAAPVAAPASSH